ncbi:trehalose-phosphatase [Tianweitania sp. BSSL-BM11]|uniref:Trehalose 6-phosphate phosphatase n=1 Tax=Tianweitania aestuarii TaxID=2814886 RepID=A0ABS5RUC2_9HYPH|nr:trehalose-phosphatase [Tianweitania aestuarii]MBS9720653.1 trehalose-phosphatase [Tianweitania aestuarii]
MTETLPRDSLDPAKTAFFLDCDGTLASIVDKPDAARVEPEIVECLRILHAATDGALAVISGRSIAQLDVMLAPLVLPVAGVHGIERRDGAGAIYRPEFDAAAVLEIASQLDAFAAQHEGLVSEVKSASVAIHYRMRPELEGEALSLMSEIAAEHEDFRLLRGKMVAELSASHRTKGDAIDDFMLEAPFRDRLPIFVGDDVTDEDGFAAVARINGIGIKIGAGTTSASHRVGTMDDFHEWLRQLCQAWTSAVPAL